MRVFMSYSRADKEFARQIAEELEARGFEVWQDVKDIKVGESIISSIESAITTSDFFCLILSDHSVKRDWVLREYRTALNRQLSTEGQQPRILPVLLESCQIPELLRDIRYADFSRSFREGLEDLFVALGVRVEDKTPYIELLNYIEKHFSDIDGLIAIFEEEKWDTLSLTTSYTILQLAWNAVSNTKDRLVEYFKNGITLIHATDHVFNDNSSPNVPVLLLPPLLLSSDVEDCFVCGPGEWHAVHGFTEGIIELLDSLKKWRSHLQKRHIFLLPTSCEWFHDNSYSDRKNEKKVIKVDEIVSQLK